MTPPRAGGPCLIEGGDFRSGFIQSMVASTPARQGKLPRDVVHVVDFPVQKTVGGPTVRWVVLPVLLVALVGTTACLNATPKTIDAVDDDAASGETADEFVLDTLLPDLEMATDQVAENATPDEKTATESGFDSTDGSPDGCVPVCGGKACGDDGCGGSCGGCTGGQVCQQGACACASQSLKACCGQAVCWFDSCGTQGQKVVDCPNGCSAARCIGCTSQCAGRKCGEDGCGGDCGFCAEGMCEGLHWTMPATCASGQCAGGGGLQDCDDLNPCTQDACDPKLGCGHWTLEDGTQCQPSTCSALTWTKPKTCDSGQCKAGGGTQTCVDGNPCTDDTCFSGAGCVFTPNTKACDDGDPCTTGDTCAGGACVGKGALVCDDQNPCTDDYCAKGIGCKADDVKDGTVCTAGSCMDLMWTMPKKCLHGACTTTGTQDCADGSVCTNDTCDVSAGCSTTLQDGNCLIDGICHADGDASGKCLECEPTNRIDAWTYKAGKPCDDENPCTKDDNCVVGGVGDAGCQGAPYSCDDGLTCTTDACDGAGACKNALQTSACLIDGKCWGDGQPNPDNACTECSAGKDATVWTNVLDGAICSAPKCTSTVFSAAKACVAGQCSGGGGIQDCNDNLDCTLDTCSPTGCTNAIQATTCLISGVCYSNGQSGNDPCKVCKPTTSLSTWSNAVDGVDCGGGRRCIGGTCVTCTQDCSGKVCGDNGCGGSCGTCQTGLTCVSGACTVVNQECGNGVVEGSEECDGQALGGKECGTLGYFGGTLGCRKDCTFDTILCGTDSHKLTYSAVPNTTLAKAWRDVAWAPDGTYALLVGNSAGAGTVARFDPSNESLSKVGDLGCQGSQVAFAAGGDAFVVGAVATGGGKLFRVPYGGASLAEVTTAADPVYQYRAITFDAGRAIAYLAGGNTSTSNPIITGTRFEPGTGTVSPVTANNVDAREELRKPDHVGRAGSEETSGSVFT